MKLDSKLIIIVIILVGFLLRFMLIDKVPGFYFDEPYAGYNAYSIMQTGKDSFGYSWPVFLAGQGDEHAVYIYTMIPFIAIFGLNEFAVRMPNVLFGTLTVLIVYLLAKEMFSRRAGYVAALLVALSPWAIQYSRMSWQVYSLAFFSLLFIYLFYVGVKRRPLYLMLSGVAAALCFYCYTTSRLWVPLLILGSVLIFRKDLWKQKKAAGIAAVLFVLLSLPFLLVFISNYEVINSRFAHVSVFNMPNPIGTFLGNYLAHFSPDFLFFNGDKNIRHSVPGIGQLYLFELPLVIAGIYFAMKRKDSLSIFLLFWLLIFPIPASMTIEDIPHASRTIQAVGLFEIFSALAVITVYDLWKKGTDDPELKDVYRIGIPLFLAAISILALFNVSSYVGEYFGEYPVYSSYAFNYGMKDAIDYIDSVKGNRTVVLSYRTLAKEFVLFYKAYPPDKYLKEGLVGYEYCDFSQQNCYDPGKNAVYLLHPEDLPEIQPTKTINYPVQYPWGNVAYKIIY